jgi:hypothetical protein
MPTYADVCKEEQVAPPAHRAMLTYADVCRRMPTYADVCKEEQVAPPAHRAMRQTWADNKRTIAPLDAAFASLAGTSKASTFVPVKYRQCKYFCTSPPPRRRRA